MKKKKKIADIIIPHHNRHDHLKNCLDSLPEDLFNVIIVSGGSFAKNCNKGARIAETDTLIFMNDDVIANHKSLVELANAPEDFVGITEFIPSLGKYFYGINFRIEDGHIKGYKTTGPDEMLFPCGFMFKVKRSIWEEMEGFNEEFINGGEDGDFGLRMLEAGHSVGWIDKPVTHFHSQSSGRLKYSKENQEILESKWTQEKLSKVLEGEVNGIKKLDILIATNHLDRLGGSETWTLTMAKELRKRHNVDVFTLKTGNLIQTVKPKDEYDLILINHNTCLKALKDVKGFKIFTSHGVFPALEQPQQGADAYVAISEEVADHVKEMGYDCEIILNGIDTDRFKPQKSINIKVKKVLSMCQGEEATKLVKQACNELGLKFEGIERNVVNVEDYINKADLVVSLGRGAYEAMSCGRAVFVFDKRVYINEPPFGDGLVKIENWQELVKNNFSGRARKLQYNVEDIKNNILAYEKSMGEINRQIALEHFNVKNQAKKYLDIYDKQISKNY